MPEKKTMGRAKKDKQQGKSPSTQAGEFVREEIHHIREGKHGATSTKQAIAIGLSKARRAGVRLGAPKKSSTSARTRKQAKRDVAKGQRHSSGQRSKPSGTRSRAARRGLAQKPRSVASRSALSRQARTSARRRPASARRASAKRAARTRAKQG
jgi:hypothetical protein